MTASDDEENDIFGAHQLDFVPPAPMKAAGVAEVDFDGVLSPPLRVHEDLKNGCGGQLWPAGMVLGKYMLRKHKDNLAGKTMLVQTWSFPIFSVLIAAVLNWELEAASLALQ
jgi:hypothetical protein